MPKLPCLSADDIEEEEVGERLLVPVRVLSSVFFSFVCACTSEFFCPGVTLRDLV